MLNKTINEYTLALTEDYVTRQHTPIEIDFNLFYRFGVNGLRIDLFDPAGVKANTIPLFVIVEEAPALKGFAAISFWSISQITIPKNTYIIRYRRHVC